MNAGNQEHPGLRSFGLVVLLSAVTLGVFWYIYIHRLFSTADRRRSVPFFGKTFAAMVGLAALTVVALLWVGLPGPGADDGPFASYQQDGGAFVETPVPVAEPPGGRDVLSWQTNAAEILLVATAIVTAAFLFMEVGRFHPAITSPIALPALTLAYLPFAFIPGVGWAALVVGLLTLVAMHDLHRGLMAFFEGKDLDGGPYGGLAAVEPVADAF